MFGHRIDPTLIAKYLDRVGFAGDERTGQRWRSFLASATGKTGSVSYLESEYLRGLGFTGTLADMVVSWVASEDGLREKMTTGENLVDYSKLVKGRTDSGAVGFAVGTTKLIYSGNQITFATNTQFRGFVSDYISVTPGKTYTYSISYPGFMQIVLDYYNSGKTWVSKQFSLTGVLTFTVPAGTLFVRVSVITDTAATHPLNTDMVVSNLKLEPSVIVTPWVPYK